MNRPKKLDLKNLISWGGSKNPAFFYFTGNFVEFSDKVKSPPGRILSYREQDKTGFNDLVWWTVWVEKKR